MKAFDTYCQMAVQKDQASSHSHQWGKQTCGGLLHPVLHMRKPSQRWGSCHQGEEEGGIQARSFHLDVKSPTCVISLACAGDHMVDWGCSCWPSLSWCPPEPAYANMLRGKQQHRLLQVAVLVILGYSKMTLAFRFCLRVQTAEIEGADFATPVPCRESLGHFSKMSIHQEN